MPHAEIPARGVDDASTHDPRRHVALQLTAWARGTDCRQPSPGEAPQTYAAVVVAESPAAVEWLADPATGIVGAGTLVVAASPRRATLPTGPGHWVACNGTASEIGEELGVGRDLYVLSTDLVSLRYQPVVGPTVVRLSAADDVESLYAAALAAMTGDRVPLSGPLLSSVVELGDRPSLTSPTAVGLPAHLHVDRDGVVRRSPFGRQLATIGSTVAEIHDAALAAGVSGYVPSDVADALAAVHHESPGLLAGYAAAVDAARLLGRTGRQWSVKGIRRSDVQVLRADDESVLVDVLTGRAFRVEPRVAEAVEAILVSDDENSAANRLRKSGHQGSAIEALLRQSLAVLAGHGVAVTYATAA